MNLNITFDAAQITVGGQTITGPASASVPVTPEQLVALLSGGGGRMEIAPEPPPALDALSPSSQRNRCRQLLSTSRWPWLNR